MIEFAIHVAVGACAFIVVLLAAVAISFTVRLIDGFVPESIRTGADWAEKALFWVDLFLFSLFVLNEAVLLIRGLWEGGWHHD